MFFSCAGQYHSYAPRNSTTPFFLSLSIPLHPPRLTAPSSSLNPSPLEYPYTFLIHYHWLLDKKKNDGRMKGEVDGKHNTAVGLTVGFPNDRATATSDGRQSFTTGQEKGEYCSSLKSRRWLDSIYKVPDGTYRLVISVFVSHTHSHKDSSILQYQFPRGNTLHQYSFKVLPSV